MLVDGEELGTIEGAGSVECTFAAVPFKPRTYDIVGEVREGFGRLIDNQRWARFQVEDEADAHGAGAVSVSRSLHGAPINVPYRWRHPQLNRARPNGL